MFSFRPFMTILLSEKCGLVCTNPKKAERKHCEAETRVVEENEGLPEILQKIPCIHGCADQLEDWPGTQIGAE